MRVGEGVPVGVSLTELDTAPLGVSISLPRGLAVSAVEGSVAADVDGLELVRVTALNEGVKRALPLSAPRAVRESVGGEDADGASDGEVAAEDFAENDGTPGAVTVDDFSRAAKDGAPVADAVMVRANETELTGDREVVAECVEDGDPRGERETLADLESLGDAEIDAETCALSVGTASDEVGETAAGADSAGELDADMLRNDDADAVFVAEEVDVAALETLCVALAASAAVEDTLGAPLLVTIDADAEMVTWLALAEAVASVDCVELC